ncbi:GTP-binding protein [Nannocystis pusilla]|uniref:GTP-binding protein n=1 Tax=Nannocystis pusilla TaxID=889268 RepID=UPI003B7621B9
MAVYERDRARIVIRVVYDGPGRAGKTTNVEQLARIFGNKPGNELQVHPAATGRTIYFDWFSFDGGMIDGHPLQVQVVTVPGHKSLDPRRAHILHTADVVVLVCDCAAAGPDAAREMLDSLREHLVTSARPVPLVVQANKQDLANAMSPQKLGAALGVGYDTPVVGAQASAGIGVRETVIGAIRAAVRQMKRRMAKRAWTRSSAGPAPPTSCARPCRTSRRSAPAAASANVTAPSTRPAASRPRPSSTRAAWSTSARRSWPPSWPPAPTAR